MKKQNVLKYIFLSLCVLLNVFIIAESALPGDLSANQSNFFGYIFAFLINNNVSYQEEYVPVSDINIENNIESIGIVYGTTQRITYEILPSNASNKSISYTISDDDNFNVVRQGNSFYIESYSSDAFGEFVIRSDDNKNISKTIQISGIPLQKPDNYTFSLSNDVLLEGYSSYIDIQYNDYTNYNDALRYFDESLLEFASSDPDVASVDEYNVIHALNEGVTYIYETTNVNNKIKLEVKNNTSSLVYPTKITIKDNLNPHIYDLDYDDIFSQVEVDFNGNIPSDTNLTYQLIGDPLVAKIDRFGRLKGYKKTGQVTLKVISNMDHNVYDEILLNVSEAIADDITLSNQDNIEIYLNDTLTINASFSPINTTNKNLTIENYEQYFDIVYLGQSIQIKPKMAGDVTIIVSTQSNPNIKKELNIKILQPQVINEDNYDDLHSFVRKFMGHFILFLVNGVITFLAMFYLLKDNKKLSRLIIILSFSLLIGLCIAGFSELIQLYTYLRSGLLSDVGIDFLGFVIGSVITYLIIHLIRYIKKRKTNNHNKNDMIDNQKDTDDLIV